VLLLIGWRDLGLIAQLAGWIDAWMMDGWMVHAWKKEKKEGGRGSGENENALEVESRRTWKFPEMSAEYSTLICRQWF